MSRRSLLTMQMIWVAWLLMGSTHAQGPTSFRDEVAPILQEHCVACHSAKRAEGGYRLDTIEQMLKPGEGGTAPVVPAKSAESEWVIRIKHNDAELRMPAESEPLPPELVAKVSKWIDEGGNLDGLNRTEPMWSVIPPKTYPSAPEHYPAALPITALAFTPDGSQLLTSGYHEVLVWNTAVGDANQTASLAGRIGNQVQRIHAIVQDADPTKIIVGGGTPGSLGEVRLVNRGTGMLEKVVARGPDVVLDIALRPGNKELAVALADNTVRIIDLEKGEQRRLIASHADWVTQLAYSEDGKRLGSASRDKSAKVVDAESGELLVSYPGHAASVRGIASFQNGQQWISVGGDNKLHRWEVENAKKVAEVGLGGEGSKLIRDQALIWIPNTDKHWYRFDLSNNTVTLKQPGHEDWVTSVAVHLPSGKLATGGHDGTIRIWNLADGALVRTWLAKP